MVCIIMINFVFSINIDALPKGVERVSIENWKKTREINEVEGDERKLNSEIITDIKNTDVNDDEVQLLTSLLFIECLSLVLSRVMHSLLSLVLSLVLSRVLSVEDA